MYDACVSRPCVCVCVYWLSSLYTTLSPRSLIFDRTWHSHFHTRPFVFIITFLVRIFTVIVGGVVSRLVCSMFYPFRCENYCGFVYTVIRYTRYRSFRDYEVVVCERKSYSPTPETSGGVTSWVIIVGDRESGGCYGTLDSVIGVWFPDNARCLARILCTICAQCVE